jgi:glycosyltransferase involved in cell wall biosynthesis
MKKLMENQAETSGYTILALGFAKWWGCDPRALAQSFRALGHTLIEVDAEDFVPWRWNSFLSRVLRRLFTNLLVREYNRAVVLQARTSAFDFVLVFKGMHLNESTLAILRSLGKPVYNFYPDVSFEDHGSLIPRALRYYDCVFTTKSFHSKAEIELFKIRELVQVRHGFDREVHRPVGLSQSQLESYGCDVSFVGCWSPKKERLISYILTNRKNYKVVVFGIGWQYASLAFKKALGKNLRPGAFGDELAIIYNASKVNLGLLSCAAGDSSVSDKTTVRTFQIPASRSVMLHEDTMEVRSYFLPEKEVMLFTDESDLLIKLDRMLSDDSLREIIRSGGYQRCINDSYDYSDAAKIILEKFEKKAN